MIITKDEDGLWAVKPPVRPTATYHRVNLERLENILRKSGDIREDEYLKGFVFDEFGVETIT